jgi:hypothetical protein
VSRRFWWIGMIIGFTFVEGNNAKKDIELFLYWKILKFTYLNLNICKVIQVFWEEVLLDGVL